MSVIAAEMQLETSNKQIMEGLKLYTKDFVCTISVAIGQQRLEQLSDMIRTVFSADNS